MRKWRKIDYVINDNNCFICTSHKSDTWGYFRIKENKEVKMLHRVVYEECFCEIPEEMVVRHKCDNPSCINPEHLEIGTQQDNVNDRVERGRSAIGSKHSNSKLNESDVIEIREKLDEGFSLRSLSKEFGVHERVIFDIKHKNMWKHVE